MSAAPSRQTAASIRSQRSGRKPSTAHSQPRLGRCTRRHRPHRRGPGVQRGCVEGQQPRERRQRSAAGQEPQQGPFKAKPSPKGEASGDFGESGGDVDGKRFHASTYTRMQLPLAVISPGALICSATASHASPGGSTARFVTGA